MEHISVCVYNWARDKYMRDSICIGELGQCQSRKGTLQYPSEVTARGTALNQSCVIAWHSLGLVKTAIWLWTSRKWKFKGEQVHEAWLSRNWNSISTSLFNFWKELLFQSHEQKVKKKTCRLCFLLDSDKVLWDIMLINHKIQHLILAGMKKNTQPIFER